MTGFELQAEVLPDENSLPHLSPKFRSKSELSSASKNNAQLQDLAAFSDT